ncbi:hypothetical protein G7046_g5934 [Stylonectria norvegica]|nr:hypothetical protein G7046_g5934 [Stylonectria norvegica]
MPGPSPEETGAMSREINEFEPRPREPTCIQPDPDGDLILIVGEEEMELRVHSLLLKLASPVFAVMLGPNFSEGRKLQEAADGEPVIIPLPDDDAQSFLTLYRVLRGPEDELEIPNAGALLELGVLVDKYNFVSRFKFPANYWFQTMQENPSTNPKRNWDLIMAAYWFQSPKWFRCFGIILQGFDFTGYYGFALQAADQTIGLKLCLLIEQNRSATGNAKKGFCLECFKVVKMDILNKKIRCKTPHYHEIKGQIDIFILTLKIGRLLDISQSTLPPVLWKDNSSIRLKRVGRRQPKREMDLTAISTNATPKEVPEAKRRKLNETEHEETPPTPWSLARSPALDGDLILVVGEEKAQIRVHSLFLKTASLVFAAMLGPNFSEGKRLRESSGDPVFVDLPDDEPEAFATVCHVLHGSNKIIEELSIEGMADVAVLVDKYDFVSRFKFPVYWWFEFVSKNQKDYANNPRTIWDLMIMAYWLQQRRFFHRFGKEFAKYPGSPPSYGYAKEATDEALGFKLSLLIERNRQAFKSSSLTAGFCLGCFKVAQDDVLERRPQCRQHKYHKRLLLGSKDSVIPKVEDLDYTPTVALPSPPHWNLLFARSSLISQTRRLGNQDGQADSQEDAGMSHREPAVPGEDAAITESPIAPDGDIIFIVGEEKRRIQVYSKFMTNASPVFTAMLGPNFKEGHDLRQSTSVGQPGEVSLPDDDPESFYLICRILHCKPSEHYPEAFKVLQVVCLAEKYDVLKPVSYVVKCWIDWRLEKHEKPYQLWCLLLACRRLCMGTSFTKISKALISCHKGSMMQLAMKTEEQPELSSLVTDVNIYKLAGTLEMIRQDTIAKLANKLIFDAVASFSAGHCEQTNSHMETYFDALSLCECDSEALIPHPSIPYSTSIDNVFGGWGVLEAHLDLECDHCTPFAFC